ncbi:MAG: hypothetical protein A2252_08525 [Elusimicrobia bacterium RIFOXYA2_FULL_39_19]|nr:MAG: hypothetical protein A2252_08525 [Elusimicrobia bacterium RIFOXYA2_FULL_39_19]
MKIVTSKTCWEYRHDAHPESPERVKLVYEYLSDKSFSFLEPKPCTETDLLTVHTKLMVDKVKTGNYADLDIPIIPRIYDYALLSAGGALLTANEAVRGNVSFCLTRPPGHHATRSHFGGFCYFNNIAIAVKSLLKEGKGKIAILDIDCHHGNGTQSIFQGKEDVLFVSLHQSPLYPGSGLESVKNCINLPLPAGTQEKDYLLKLEEALIKIKDFKPAIIAVSAGFDTYKADPLTDILLDTFTYTKIASMIKELNLPRFALLEGGYSADLPECVYRFLLGFE